MCIYKLCIRFITRMCSCRRKPGLNSIVWSSEESKSLIKFWRSDSESKFKSRWYKTKPHSVEPFCLLSKLVSHGKVRKGCEFNKKAQPKNGIHVETQATHVGQFQNLTIWWKKSQKVFKWSQKGPKTYVE